MRIDAGHSSATVQAAASAARIGANLLQKRTLDAQHDNGKAVAVERFRDLHMGRPAPDLPGTY
jgi:hypothetical protein